MMPRSVSPPPRSSRENDAGSTSHSRRGEDYRNGSSSARGDGGSSSDLRKRERYEDRDRDRDRNRYREQYRSSRDREEDRRRYRRYDDATQDGSSSRYERDSASRSERPREGLSQRSTDRDPHRPRDGHLRHGDDRSHDRDRRSPARSRRSPLPRSRDEPSSSSRSAPRTNFEEDRRRERERYDTTSGPPSAASRSRAAEGSAPSTSTGAPEGLAAEEAEEDQDQPDFKPSGLLAKESNQVNGTALKYHEPPEAKKPKRKWRLYVFKDGKEVDLLHLSRQSCYLFGRDQAVVDVPLEHTSCSKQHAVLQYRLLIERNEFGDEKRNIKPYLLDLASANGTTVNKRSVPASRYYELKNGDTIQFGGSEREYVLLCED